VRPSPGARAETAAEAAPAPHAPETTAIPSGTLAAAAPPQQGRLVREVLVTRAIAAGSRVAAPRPPAGRPIWVVGDGGNLARAIVQHMGSLGLEARLATAAGDPPAGIDQAGGLLILGTARPVDAAGVWAPEAERFLKHAFTCAQRAATSLRELGLARGAFLVTVSRLDGAFGTGRLDETLDPLSGGLAGLTKTLAHEWPDVRCRALDVPSRWMDAPAVAAAIATEALLEGPREVGLSPDAAVTLETAEAPALPGAARPPFGRGDVVVISGGARGVTAAVATALGAAQPQSTLVLLGRTAAPQPEPDWLAGVTRESEIKRAIMARERARNPSPRELEAEFHRWMANREVLATLQRIQERGGRVVYESVDVRDRKATAECLARVRRDVGPIRGLIHGAGVLADRHVVDKTAEQFDLVFDTKVAGLASLIEATAEDPLGAIVLFSSITGRRGRTGQVDYAMANEVLNKVAQQQARRRPTSRVLALNWGPWDGGMVTPSLARMFRDEGVGLIGLDEGADLLVRELGREPGGPVEVVVLSVPVEKGGSSAGPARGPGSGTIEQRTGATVAAGAPPASRSHAAAFERQLDLASVPVLRSHVLDSRPVLPVALMVEWMGHAALHGNPGLVWHGLEDLRVFRGIVLRDRSLTLRAFASRLEKLKAGETPATGNRPAWRVATELRSSDERDGLHARANVLLVERLPHPNGADSGRRPLPRKPYGRPVDEAYDRLLFHGPHLRGLEAIESVTEEGASARVRCAPPPSEWMQDPLRDTWLADPLVLDSAFQLAIVWSSEQRGAGCLPCHLGRYRQFRSRFPREGTRIALHVSRLRGSLLSADIVFTDASGRTIAILEGYEATLDASLAAAFQRREVPGDQAATGR
jgi:NADP-dependent 3-hydroxy acid dehydrogenase YdfG